MQQGLFGSTTADMAVHCLTPPSPDDSLILGLQAAMGKTTPGNYLEEMDWLLANLDNFKEVPAIANDTGYKRAVAVKSALSSLGCHLFNFKAPREKQDEVSEMEDLWAGAILQFNRKIIIKDTDVRTVARYLLWEKYYPAVNAPALFRYAQSKGILRREVNRDTGEITKSLVVIGLEMKVGNNVYTVDAHGRHYRQYLRTYGRQSFYINQKVPEELVEAGFLDEVPPLDDTYGAVTSVCDGKHCARPIALNRREKAFICRTFVGINSKEAIG